MKKKDYYFIVVSLTVVLAASTAFGLVGNATAPEVNTDGQTAETGNNSCTNAVYCDTTANSFLACTNVCSGKTGIEIAIEQVLNWN